MKPLPYHKIEDDKEYYISYTEGFTMQRIREVCKVTHYGDSAFMVHLNPNTIGGYRVVPERDYGDKHTEFEIATGKIGCVYNVSVRYAL